jgi:hypothetical protein
MILVMAFAEDVRKVLQDLVTPEMRAMSERVDGMGKQITTLREEMNRRFDYLERPFRLDERITALEDKLSKPAKRQESH